MKILLAMTIILFGSMGAFARENISCKVPGDVSAKLERYVSGRGRGSKIQFNLISQACKAWPQAPGLMIVVKPYEYVGWVDGRNEDRFGMVVSVVDSDSGSIVGMFDEPEMMVVDAIEPVRVEIDAASYRIDDSKFAFGVRVARKNNSRVNLFYEAILNLYALDRRGLTRIVDGLLVESGSGEGDGNCYYLGSDKMADLYVEKSVSNGYFDFAVKVRSVKNHQFESDGVCVRSATERKSKKHILRFDGKAYRIPEPLRAHLN